MNLTKEQVCVLIENETQLNEARRILEQSGEDIAVDGLFSLTIETQNYLKLDHYTEWYLGAKRNFFTQITLEELEKLLKQ